MAHQACSSCQDQRCRVPMRDKHLFEEPDFNNPHGPFLWAVEGSFYEVKMVKEMIGAVNRANLEEDSEHVRG